MGISDEISPADAHGGSSPGKEQQAAGVGILLQIMMLVLSFVLGHVLRRHKFYYLPEASASLLIGIYICIMLHSMQFDIFYKRKKKKPKIYYLCVHFGQV